MQRILVTGSSGFIGKHLMEALWSHHKSEDVEFHQVSRQYRRGFHTGDLSDESHVANLMDMVRPHTVYHLAANPIVRSDADDPTKISRDNILATHNLLAHAPRGCRFVFASSATVYGNRSVLQILTPNESMPTLPSSVYGATKAASESLVQAYTTLGLVSGVSLRLVANVGPGATHGLLYDVIRKLRSESEYLELLGDCPGSIKPFLHVEDAVRAFVWASTIPVCQTGCININISPGVILSVETVAKLAMEVLGIHKPTKWLGESANWKGDNRRMEVSSRLSENLGFTYNYPTSTEAIRQALLEMKDN